MGARKPTLRIEFSQKAIEKLPVPQSGRVHYYDSKREGLGTRVESNGRKSFFWFRKVKSKPVFKMIGQHPSTSVEGARAAANEWNGDLDKFKRHDYEGDNPFTKQRGVPTLGEILADDRRLAKSDKVKDPVKAVTAAKWLFGKYLGDWRDRKLSSITQENIVDLHQALKESSGLFTANRVLQLLKALFNWAIKSKLWKGINPAVGIDLFGEKEHRRKRFVQSDEMARLYKAFEQKPNRDLADFVRLALHTGARRGDIFSMQWTDISVNVNRQWQWRVASPKNNEPYDVPLVAETVKVLSERRRLVPTSNPWVFPSFGKSGHLVDLKKRWAELIKRAKIENLRIHDLRRTTGSWQAIQGTSLLLIGKSLGHASTQSTEVYSRVNLDPIRKSLTNASRAMIAASKKKPKLLAEATRV